MRILVPIVALTITAAACGSYFAPDRNVRDTPDDSAVVGIWQLTPRSLRLLERDGFRRDASQRYVVTFNSDRSCEFASVLDGEDKGGTYVVVPCTWTLEHDTTGDSNVRKANALRIDLERDRGSHQRVLNFARDDGKLILWNYYRDPDLWEFIEYSRVGSPAPRKAR